MKIKIVIVFCLLLSPQWSHAARFYFAPEEITEPPGVAFMIDVFLDPEGETVNAFEGTISLPVQSGLTVSEIRISDSIVGLWLEEPAWREGKITFSAVVPGGFAGNLSPFYTGVRPGKLFSLVLVGSQSGRFDLSWSNVAAYRHDQTSSATVVRAEPLALTLDPAVTHTLMVADEVSEDQTPPDDFAITLAQEPSVWDNQWFAVFATRDTGSGVARYEVQEHRSLVPLAGEWRNATSPYLLVDQSLSSYLSVRAVDRAGNEQLVTLSPAVAPRPYANRSILIIILLLCLCALFYYYLYSRRRS